MPKCFYGEKILPLYFKREKIIGGKLKASRFEWEISSNL